MAGLPEGRTCWSISTSTVPESARLFIKFFEEARLLSNAARPFFLDAGPLRIIHITWSVNLLISGAEFYHVQAARRILILVRPKRRPDPGGGKAGFSNDPVTSREPPGAYRRDDSADDLRVVHHREKNSIRPDDRITRASRKRFSPDQTLVW